MLLFLRKCWSFIKKYWQLLGASVVFICLYVLFRGREMNFAEYTQEIRKKHSEELDVIEQARELEREKVKLAQQRYEEAIVKINEQYESGQRELNNKKKKEIKTIIDKHGDNPGKVTDMIAELTGFEVELDDRSN